MLDAAAELEPAKGSLVRDPPISARFRLSEVLHKNDIAAERILLCIKDCLFVRSDRQSRHSLRRAVETEYVQLDSSMPVVQQSHAGVTWSR